jgi:RNA polymerase sigma factor for flagellar operon FliA
MEAELRTDNFTRLSEDERRRLIEQYQPYVRKLAREMFVKMDCKFDLEELIAYGTLGLVEAAERFNPSRGFRFVTFAHYRIKGAIFDGLRQMGLPPRATNRRRQAKFEAAAADLLQTADDDETNQPQTIADEVKSIENLIDNLIPTYLLSLDSEEAQSVADTGAAAAQAEIEAAEALRFVRAIIAELPEQERELLTAIYYKQISMTEIAARQGITKSWVSRLHARAVARIRDKLREIGFLPPD